MKNLVSRIGFIALPALITALGGTGASAQEVSEPANARAAAGIGEIVVTARRREESLQSTPVAITAVTEEMLEDRNVEDLMGISRITPNFTLYEISGGLGSALLYIRGIGHAESVPGQDSPIAVYSDGVLMGRNSTATMDIVEPERVEVLRGPQGTLFGRNTTGGAILITTHVPDDEVSGMMKASYGRFNSMEIQGRYDTGLLGESGVKASFAYTYRENDGTFDDIDRPDSLDPGARETNSYWGKVALERGDFDLVVTGDYSKLKGTPSPVQVVVANPEVLNYIALSPTYGGGSYTVTQEPQYRLQDAFEGIQTIEAKGLGLTAELIVSDNITLKSITGIRAYSRDEPAGYGPGNLRGLTVFNELATFEGLYGIPDRGQKQSQESQEIQLLGTAGDVDYVLGGYYYHEAVAEQTTARLPFVQPSGVTAFEFISDRRFSADTKSYAGFGQANWRPGFLDNRLELSVGLRYTEDKKKYDQVLPFERQVSFDNNNWSYLLSVNYQISPDAMVYAKYSTGYRSGGYNVRANSGFNPIFEPEKIKAVEGGFKLDLFNNRFRLNGAVFYNDYSDLQAGSFIAPADGSLGGTVSVNANAVYKGVELEAELVPADGLSLRGSFGYTDPQYDNYPTALIGGAVSAGCDGLFDGLNNLVAQDCADTARFTHFPKLNLDTSINYIHSLGAISYLSTTLSYTYRSRFEFSAFDNAVTPYRDEVSQKGYGLLSGRMAISDLPLGGNVLGQIAVFGDNLTNEEYAVLGIDFRTYGIKYFGTRRTWGLEAKISF